MAINSTEWQNRYEVWDRLEPLLPAHLVQRKMKLWNKGFRVRSFHLTVAGGQIRHMMRNGEVERSIPIGRDNHYIGNYSLRLTPKGMARRKNIRRYICNRCLNTDFTEAIADPICGHCHCHHLTLTPA